MHVRDIMSTPVFAVGHTDSLKVAEDVMEWKHIRHLPVIDEDGHLAGLITHRDLLRACVSSIAEIPQQEQDALLRGIPVREIMHGEVVTVEPESDAREAARTMLEKKIGCLPVVDGGKLVGILTEADFVSYLLEILE
ncbi:MAG: CBS domain-containing protein [Candidatus Krumholzibacteriia bacterium]